MIQITVQRAVPDRKYRVMVNLIRADKPRYWNFLCLNCGAVVVHLANTEVYSLDDFWDPQDINLYGVAKDCKGTLATGESCFYTYFFHDVRKG